MFVRKMILLSKKWQLLFIFLVVLFGLILRLWNLSQYLYFAIDETRDLFIVRKILIEHRPVLIGTEPASTKFHLGPLYYYITAFFAAIFNMNPVGLGLIAAVLGTITILLVYLVSKKLFNRNIAVLASILYSTSYLIVIYNKIYWPLVYAPIVTLGVYFALYKIINERNSKYFFLLVAALILGMQSEASTISLLILSFVFIIPLVIRKKVKMKYLIFTLAIILLSHSTLVIFDLRHNFQNSKAIVSLFSNHHEKSEVNFNNMSKQLFLIVNTFSRIIYKSGPNDVARQISPCAVYETQKNQIPVIFQLFTLSVLIFGLFRLLKGKSLGLQLIFGHLTIIFTGILALGLIFPYYLHEWLLYLYFPSFVILIACFLSEFTKKRITSIIVYLVVFAIVIANSKAIISGNNNFGYQQKYDAVMYSLEVLRGKSFSVDSLGECFGWGGYRYIYWLKNQTPATSYMDNSFGGWLYPQDWIEKDNADIVVAFVDHDISPPGGSRDQNYYKYLEKYSKYKSREISSKKFGNTEVIIVDNKDHWVEF